MIALGLMVSDKTYVIMMKIKLMGPGLANSHSDQTVGPSSDILHKFDQYFKNSTFSFETDKQILFFWSF